MPQLKRLVPSAADAAVVAPEQLFARALHDHAQQETRREAAALCAARAYSMAEAEEEDDADSDLPLQHVAMPARSPGTLSLRESVQKAVVAAHEDDKSSLFIVDNAAYVTKLMRTKVDAESVEAPRRDPLLTRISLQQTREIHVLLTILDEIQHLESNCPAYVFIGPLSGFFAPFLTTSGLTTTGDGLLRMLQLACKRLQRSQPATTVTIIRDRPQFES